MFVIKLVKDIRSVGQTSAQYMVHLVLN